MRLGMAFDHQDQADLYARTERYLRQAFGDVVDAVADQPAFFVELGGRSCLITVLANGPDTALMVYTKLGGGLAITPEVARFLLRRSHEQMPFGSLGLQEDDELAVHHLLFGETVTEKTFRDLLSTLAESCEELEEELDRRFRWRPPGPRPVD
jgi:hypothetical protein